MIPILYAGNEQSFTSNGLGRLSDAISCKVIEERNATYELEMTYPVTGVHFSEIQEGRIILAQPCDGGLTQPFTIYQITKPLNQVVTVKAQHISYQLSGIVVMPFSANSCVSAIAGIKNYSSTSNPFSFMTDKSVTGSFNVSVPTSARALLCGQSGSLLDVYGKGDYEFNRYDVKLWVNRGTDNGVTLRYGKNITDLKSVVDITNVYTGIVPYWTDGSGNTMVLPEHVVLSGHESEYPFKIIKSVDFSSEWENQPTEAQLREKAQSYLASNEGWKLKNNITISFVALWNTEEYKNIAPLERVKMCDVVHVVIPQFGINFSTKVVKTDYDVLQGKYNSITLGDTYYTLNTYFQEELSTAEEQQSSHMQQAIARATKLIQGGLGGYVVFNVNAQGQPQEILIMDQPDIQTAVSVIRMNKNGIGFSTSGYNGPFFTAWTIDGHFVADYIDSGTLNADLIKTGRLQDEANLNFWDMVTGDFRLTSGKINGSEIASQVDVSTGVSDGIRGYDYQLDQLKVFNKLTNNGQAQGIFLQNGELYINASVIKTGIIADRNNLNYWNMVTGDFKLSSNTKVGNSTVASVQTVWDGDTATYNSSVTDSEAYARDQDDAVRRYAADQAAYAKADAEAYSRTQDALTLTAAQVYAANGITDYDTYLNQITVFNKLTDGGTVQGIYMENGQLYINGTYIKTGTLDAAQVNVTNINAANINTGILRDASGNVEWNLNTGKLSSKKLSINSTYFELSETGSITSISQDGKKIVVDKGTITGYKSNSQLSAKLEIGDGYFNIANGVLAIQGVVGVSGSTGFVKSISYTNVELGEFLTRTIHGLPNIGTNNCTVSGGGVSLSGGGVTLSGGIASGSVTVSGTVNGQYVSLTGSVSLPVSNMSATLNNPTVNYTNPTVSINAEEHNLVMESYATWLPNTKMEYAKAVEATTGSINSQYGIIQSIS